MIFKNAIYAICCIFIYDQYFLTEYQPNETVTQKFINNFQ